MGRGGSGAGDWWTDPDKPWNITKLRDALGGSRSKIERAVVALVARNLIRNDRMGHPGS